LIGELRQGLKQAACTVSSSDVRLAIAASNLYTYPDVMVVCGDPAFMGNRRDPVSNPVLIIEVLSESTKEYDRRDKFQSYRTLLSLNEYLTVTQDKVHVEQYAGRPVAADRSQGSGQSTQARVRRC
jgi:Uma2 family endonuclease